MARRESPRVVIDLKNFCLIVKFQQSDCYDLINIKLYKSHIVVKTTLDTYRLFMSESGKGLERIIAR